MDTRKQKHRLVLLFTAIALVLPLLSACGGTGSNDATPTVSPQQPTATTGLGSGDTGTQPTATSGSAGSTGGQPVTIDVWNPETGEAVLKVINDDIAAFEQEHPNIKVNLVTIPWSDIFTKWQTAIQSGNPPDLSIASAAFGASFNQQGVAEPLDDVVKDLGGDSFWAPTAKSFVQMNQSNGHYFALPYVQNSVVLWYNKKMLSDAGLQPPKTWDELSAAAKKLTHDGVYGIMVTSSKTHVTQQGLYSLMLSNGGDIVDRQDPNKVVFDSPAVAETLKFYKDLAQYSPPGASGYDRPEAQAAMTTGKVAMFIYGAWMGGALLQAGEDVFNQYGVAPVPTNKGQGAFMGNLSLVMFNNAKHKAEAKEFMKFLMRADNYTKWCITDPAAYVPVTASTQNNPDYLNNEMVKKVKPVIDASYAGLPNAWVYGMPNPHAGELEGLNIISEVAARVVLENVDPAQAAKEGADKIREIIKK